MALALLLWPVVTLLSQFEVGGNKVVTKAMIVTHYDHYDIDHGDVAVQYTLKNAVVGNSGASTDNTVCVSQCQSKISCV